MFAYKSPSILNRKPLGLYIFWLRNFLFISIIFSVLIIYRGMCIRKDNIIAKLPESAIKYILPREASEFAPLNIVELRSRINKLNSKARILNEEIYGTIKSDTVIIVVNVYKHTKYLNYFLASLSQTRGIEDALLIFSHSYFDEQVNDLIRSIDFCRVLQIFYPYSIQLYPEEFPGFEHNDCLYNTDIETAEYLNCTGAFTPDIHGHYRNPENSEKKHHWWWTANKVFDNLMYTEDHYGLVIFVDESVYLIEDFIFMALYLKNVAKSLQQCEFISLGGDIPQKSESDSYRVEVKTWDPKYHSSVLAFDSSVWNTIVTHYNLFCDIDDYSWARSLFYLSLNRRDGTRYKVISSLLPRAIKISSNLYGSWVKFFLVEGVYEALDIQTHYEERLFPPYLEVYTDIELEPDEFIMFDHVENNGGWSDPRDKNLCSNLTRYKIKKILLDMKLEFESYSAFYKEDTY